MGFPVRDRGFGSPSPFALTKGVKWLLIINTGLFLLAFLGSDGAVGRMFGPLGLSARAVLESFAIWQLFTYMFLHSPFGFGHILVNMLTLWMFGSVLEQSWGTRRFLKYYLYCGIGAGICVVLLNAFFGSMAARTIGSSGAVYGLLLAFGVLFPDVVILFMFIFPMKARYFVILMAAIVFLSSLKASDDGVSHFAHLGGMLTGLILLRSKWMSSRARGPKWTPVADAQRWYQEWKLQRAKRKFQVYLREQDRKSGPRIH